MKYLNQFIHRSFLFIGLCTVSWTLFAADIQIRTDRNPVSLNESFQLIYETSDSVDDDPDFSPLQAHVDILNRNQSSNISIINGQYSSSKTWTLTVMAKQKGNMTLPPIYFGTNKSPAYQLTVKPASKKPQDQTGFFTRIKVDRKQLYVQQQLVVTQQLYSDSNLSAYGLGELSFTGMDVVSEALVKEKQYKTRIGNRAYLVVERSYAVYPQASGSLQLQPVLAEARTGSAASSFFGSFSNTGRVVRARSNSLEIKVMAVPAEANMNPWLPATNLQLMEQWPDNPPKFMQGEPVTRTLSLKAEGLTAAQLPEMPDISIQGLKQYPDQPLLNNIKNDSGISGYRLEKVALIPTRAGEIKLPAIEIPWWNTKTQSRQVARIPSRTITVLPSVASTPMATAPTENAIQQVEPQMLKLGPNMGAESQAVNDNQPKGGKLWMFLSAIFALGWIATALFWFIFSRSQGATAQADKPAKPTSAQQQYRQLAQACEDKDVAECRSRLLSWAQSMYSKQDVKNLNDLMMCVSREMAKEIRKIDAVLYGGHRRQINFKLIVEQAGRLMQQEKEKDSQPGPELLEPLYK